MQTLQVLTLGCSKNQVDTEHILSQVAEKFEIIHESEEEAKVDYLLINTCGFIGDAKEQSIETIMQCVDRKNRGLVGKLMVFGCLSQRYMDQMPELIPEVDAWYGARDFDPIIRDLGCEPKEELRTKRYMPQINHAYAYLKISEGCDRRCSYCAIPYIRGAHKSVPIETLCEEARILASKGIRELVLIAQDTTYYGLDLYKKRALAQLLEELSKIEGIEWIRIHYSYPASFPEDVLDQMANNPKVCKYLDIPLQHIADKVLDNMHRHVDGAWTRELISKLRTQVPGVVLRTTMIVGHPGEGRKEFNELMKFVQEAKFERLGAFTYSEEEGTYGAENFKDSVMPKTKRNRLNELMTAQSGISLAYNESRVGTVEKVLIDDYAERSFVCRSQYESPEVDGEIIVKFDPELFHTDNPSSMCGKFIEVEITGADEYDLEARLVKILE
ncbi:MAG: 30S ribosomal protein S12 methylthiotransferase RimO [Bacteroidales bacterium]|nr:30S ribosomal protein S12 methylthiotransferase RimO [Bacteroidales bacterium]